MRHQTAGLASSAQNCQGVHSAHVREGLLLKGWVGWMKSTTLEAATVAVQKHQVAESASDPFSHHRSTKLHQLTRVTLLVLPLEN